MQKTVAFTPGLYKIFDEILVNATDNKVRDPTMKELRVDIDKEKGTISVMNGGKGIRSRCTKRKACTSRSLFLDIF